MNRHSEVLTILCLVFTVGALGCDSLSAPNENEPSISSLRENPTRSAVLTATQGLMIGTRSGYAGYVNVLGIVGRESYNMDIADPRWVTDLLGQNLDPAGFGAFLWDGPYSNIRNANLVLSAVGKVEALSSEEKESIRGFAKTIQAFDFLKIINTRYENGAPIDVGREVSAEPAPIEPRDAVMGHIVTLLDEARGHLQSAGGSFPFELSSGFSGFETPSTFLEFNRALRARVAVYMQDHQTALQALDNSFLDRNTPLDRGVYMAYSGGSGDVQNGLFQPGEGRDLRAHPSVRPDAQQKPNGEPDDRFQEKTLPLPERTWQGISSDLGFTLYGSVSAPIPIIRNEELILLRAEANIGLGNVETAEDDLNFIRQQSGGLGSVDLTGETEALDELLYNKRYSLMWEGGHRWIDMRRYDRLDELPLDQPSHVVHEQFPIPADEALARQ